MSNALLEQAHEQQALRLAELRREARAILLRSDDPQPGDGERILTVYELIGRPIDEIADDARLLRERMSLGDYVQAADDALNDERIERAEARERMQRIEEEQKKRNAEFARELANLESRMVYLKGAERRNGDAIAAGRKLDDQLAGIVGYQSRELSQREIAAFNERARNQNEANARAAAEAEQNRIAGGVPQAEAAFRRRLREDKEHIERQAFKNRTTLGLMKDQ